MAAASPPKDDAWPPPRRWAHCWVKTSVGNLPPLPGLVLHWDRSGTRWRAWVVWLEDHRVRQGWIEARHLRPAESDRNVWNRGPWR